VTERKPPFRQRDLARTLRSIRAAGVSATVEVTKSGTFLIVPTGTAKEKEEVGAPRQVVAA